MTPIAKNTFKKLSILWGAFFVLGLSSFAQTDSTVSKINPEGKGILQIDQPIEKIDDTSTVKQKFDFSTKNPRIATISSAIIPGLGQAYNGKYYKIPIIYGAGAIIYYFYDYNKYEWNRIKIARKELKETGAISDLQLAKFDDKTLNIYENNFRRDRDYNLLFLVLLYTANIVDAMVDSYMVEFDISNDLSMQVVPSIMPNPSATSFNATSAGLKLSFRF